jgi:hypothetical protein
MNSDDIEQFLARKANLNSDCVKISFKKRESIFGLFLKDEDYDYLKKKNFWRIVPQSKLETYKTTKNNALARIFNGEEFSKLSTYKESFE